MWMRRYKARGRCGVEERCGSVKGMRMRQYESTEGEIGDTRILKRIKGQKDKQRRKERDR